MKCLQTQVTKNAETRQSCYKRRRLTERSIAAPALLQIKAIYLLHLPHAVVAKRLRAVTRSRFAAF